MKNFINYLSKYTGSNYDDMMKDFMSLNYKSPEYVGFLRLNLDDLKNWAKDIASDWDGDLPGVNEDRAHAANRIIDYIGMIELDIEELENTDYEESDNKDDFDWSDHERELSQ